MSSPSLPKQTQSLELVLSGEINKNQPGFGIISQPGIRQIWTRMADFARVAGKACAGSCSLASDGLD
jgi:hypothetical protein